MDITIYARNLFHLYLMFTTGGIQLTGYPVSPCPKYFTYHRISGVCLGLLSVPSRVNDLPLHVHVHLSIRAALKTKYAGLLELLESPDLILKKLISTDNVTVKYSVRFPVPDPLPFVRSIYVNNVSICEGERVDGEVVTDIYLEHHFPTNIEFYDRFRLEHNNFDQTEGKCGSANLPIPLIQSLGNGEWPWLSAILLKNQYGLQFHCSGTLISSKHVITAAHCIKKENGGEIPADLFVIYLGKYNLENWAESNSQIREVSSVYIHKDFTTNFYNADIAIMQLLHPTVYDNYVRPACLWQNDISLQPLIGKLGIVVGWGKDKQSGLIRAEPRIVQLPVVDQEQCLRSRKDFLYITSEQTFCAGFENGTGLCNGDSGGGLIFLKKNKNGKFIWQLRGIISLSLLDQGFTTCDNSHYVVFTDVAKFITWIYDITQ